VASKDLSIYEELSAVMKFIFLTISF